MSLRNGKNGNVRLPLEMVFDVSRGGSCCGESSKLRNHAVIKEGFRSHIRLLTLFKSDGNGLESPLGTNMFGRGAVGDISWSEPRSFTYLDVRRNRDRFLE